MPAVTGERKKHARWLLSSLSWLSLFPFLALQIADIATTHYALASRDLGSRSSDGVLAGQPWWLLKLMVVGLIRLATP
jgi:hypothetical protein